MKEQDMDRLFARVRNAPVEMEISTVEKIVVSAGLAIALKAFLLKNLNTIIFMTTSTVLVSSVVIGLTVFGNAGESNTDSEINETVIEQGIVKDEAPEILPEKELLVANNDLDGVDEAKLEPIELLNRNEVENIHPIVEPTVETIPYPGTERETLNNFSIRTEPAKEPSDMADIGPFEGVSLDVNLEIEIRYAKDCGVRIEDNQTIDFLSLNVENNVLHIGAEKGKEKEFSKALKGKSYIIIVEMPKISTIACSSSGTIVCEDEIPSDNLSISLAGCGDIELYNLAPKSFNISVAGSGDIELGGKGQATQGQIAVSGSGDVKVPNLETQEIDIVISGSADVTVNASEQINGRISGSGDICYYGDAKSSLKSSGSGSLHKCHCN